MTCAKLTTIAIIMKGSKFWVGSNKCNSPQNICPREDLPTGVGYEMCKDICEQDCHAEVDACLKAGDEAKGGKLYLIGHTYCCDDCKEIMKYHGIKDIIIVDDNVL